MTSTLEHELAELLRETRTVAERNPFPTTFAWISEQYRTQRLNAAELADDGDVLLFHWGVVDWGDGLHAIIDLTRQILRAAASPGGDPSIWQLRCCFRYPPPLLNRIKNGKAWCAHPERLTAFVADLKSCEAWQRLETVQRTDVVVRLARL